MLFLNYRTTCSWLLAALFPRRYQVPSGAQVARQKGGRGINLFLTFSSVCLVPELSHISLSPLLLSVPLICTEDTEPGWVGFLLGK